MRSPDNTYQPSAATAATARSTPRRDLRPGNNHARTSAPASDAVVVATMTENGGTSWSSAASA